MQILHLRKEVKAGVMELIMEDIIITNSQTEEITTIEVVEEDVVDQFVKSAVSLVTWFLIAISDLITTLPPM